MRTNESSVLEFPHPTEHTDIFLPIESPTTNGGTSSVGAGGSGGANSTINGNGVILKRRSSERYLLFLIFGFYLMIPKK